MIEPLISLCMIVRNEEKNLPRCLKSVRPLVDEIVILDTGSEDNTISIAESFGAKVFRMPWPGDFAAARNESLRRAGGNWVLYMDADETFDLNGCPDCVRKTASIPSVTAWSVPIRTRKWNSASYDVTFNIRLFRNLPELLFENEVHERIEPSLVRIGAKIASAHFFIDQYSLKPNEMKEKAERNLLLSKKHLERNPDDPYCLYFVGADLLALEKRSESLKYLRRSLGSKNIPLFLEAMTRNLMALVELGEDRLDEAIELAQSSIAMVPRQNTAYMVSGIALFRKAEFDKAFPLLARAHEFFRLPADRRLTDLSQEHTLIEDVEFERLLGICLSEIDRPGEAVEHFRHFFQLGGMDPDVVRRAGICCVNACDFASGLKYLEEAGNLGVLRSELVAPMALASMKLKNFTRAKLLLEEAEKNSPAAADKIDRIKDLLEEAQSPGHELLKGLAHFQRGNHREALPLLLEAYRFVALAPRDRRTDLDIEESIGKIELVKLIGVCFAETGRFTEAVPFLKLAAHLKPEPAVFERLGVCLLNSHNTLDHRGHN